MNYQSYQKTEGKSNFNGFQLKEGEVYLIPRMDTIASVVAKARNDGLNAFNIVVDSEGTSNVAFAVRNFNKNCCFLDFDNEKTHDVAMFNNMSIDENKSLFEKNGQKVLSIKEYDLSDDKTLINLMEDHYLLFARDNESLQSHKRYLNASHLTKEERTKSIQKVATVETIQ
ncbi:hypothetical protein I2F27_09325 [Acinetobacter sp. B5B]|uniref:hypothetical protein n=1 Tax=Acinetobacter baretiae TaxID=2605383 RepID=UPI0018C1D01E|nr:hypothetical protein [Acinetobacter baretiae]MBF7683520.1 hypothetical protein [Acinetobacter baretiae]